MTAVASVAPRARPYDLRDRSGNMLQHPSNVSRRPCRPRPSRARARGNTSARPRSRPLAGNTRQGRNRCRRCCQCRRRRRIAQLGKPWSPDWLKQTDVRTRTRTALMAAAPARPGRRLRRSGGLLRVMRANVTKRNMIDRVQGFIPLRPRSSSRVSLIARCPAGAQFNCSIENSIDFSIDFC